MKTVAFVPIRLNSQRVSGKNLRLLGGEPLMCHILRTLTRVEGIDEVYVFCSDEHIVELLPEGVRFLKRSAELDRDTTLGREIYDAFTARVEADLYVLAHATSPFIRPETIAGALDKVRSGEYDSAFSAEKSRPSPGTRGARSTMRSTTFPARRPSNRSTSRPAPSSSSRGSCGARITAASATAPTWLWSSGSKGSTSIIRRISPWRKSSPPAADSEQPGSGRYFGSAAGCLAAGHSASCSSSSPARS